MNLPRKDAPDFYWWCEKGPIHSPQSRELQAWVNLYVGFPKTEFPGKERGAQLGLDAIDAAVAAISPGDL